MERFAELGVARVELHATANGEPRYRSLGFAPPGQLALDWRRPG